MNQDFSTSPGFDFALANRNPLPRKAAERAAQWRFMESSNEFRTRAHGAMNRGLLHLTRSRRRGGTTLSPEDGGEGSCGGRGLPRRSPKGEGGFTGRQTLRQAEIRHARLAVGIEKNVGRFEVAMDDTVLMGVVHRRGDSSHQLSGPAGRERLLAGQVPQMPAFDVVHRKILPSFVFSDFVNGHDVRMMQVGGGLSFDAETLDELVARE